MRDDVDLRNLYRANAEGLGRRFPDLGGVLDKMSGSTDMANISLAIPTIHPMLGLDCFPVSNHQPEFAAVLRHADGRQGDARRRHRHGVDRDRRRHDATVRIRLLAGAG